MLIEITKEQLSALEMLGVLGGYYIQNMEPAGSCYESDNEMVEEGQEVIKHIEKQFIRGTV
jgi:hypothetical protein